MQLYLFFHLCSCKNLRLMITYVNLTARLMGMNTLRICTAEHICSMKWWKFIQYKEFAGDWVRAFRVFQRAWSKCAARVLVFVLQNIKESCLLISLKHRTRCRHCGGVSENCSILKRPSSIQSTMVSFPFSIKFYSSSKIFYYYAFTTSGLAKSQLCKLYVHWKHPRCGSAGFMATQSPTPFTFTLRIRVNVVLASQISV